MTQADTAAVMQGFSLFSGLTDEQCIEVCNRTVRKRYRKNAIIITEGDSGHTLYLVVEGRIRIFGRDDSDDREIVFNELGPGDYFGELALLTGQGRMASAVAESACTLLTLSRVSFVETLHKHPAVAMQLLQDMAAHIGRLSADLSSMTFMDVYGRLARLINEGAVEEDGRLLTPAWTHQAIASRVGSSREMVTKILRDLRTGGYLAVDNKRLLILKKLPPHW